ncbi:zinc finger, CCHC-type containing protein [Tanacetum coccineum]
MTVDYRSCREKMHFLLPHDVVYSLTTPIPDDGDDATVDQIRKRAKWDNDDYVCKGLILNVMEQYNELLGILGRFTQHKMNMDEAIQVSYIIDKLPLSWKDFKHTLKHLKEEITLVELGSHLCIEESLRVQDSNKPKGNNVVGPSFVNMVERNNSSGTMTTRVNVNIMITQGLILTRRQNLLVGNVVKLVTLKGIAKVLMLATKPMVQAQKDDDVAWWVDLGATVHVCKYRCWFKTYESLNDGSILHMGNESTALVHGRGCVDIRFSSGKIILFFNVLHVPNIRKNLVSSSILNNCGYKQVIESNKFVLSKHGVFIGFGYLSNQMFRLNIVNDNIASAFMSTSKLNDSILWHARLGHVHFKRMQDMSKDGLIPAFDMDTEKCKTCMLTKITKKPFQNVKRETKVLELIHSDLCDLHATPSLGNKKYFVTFIDDASRFCYVYLLHTKDEALDKFKVFKTEVELQQGSQIKRFRTDRGGTRDEVSDQHSYYFNVEPKTFDEAIKSQDVAYGKKQLMMRWILSWATTLGCWLIYLQGFRQKSRIDYVDTYAPVARISTIRLLIAMASIHNLIIHQMDVKTTFLNGELDDEVYMNQPQGFIMLGNENKVCKLIKSLYGLKKAPKQWHQKFDEVVLSNGYLLNQIDKCVYSKFDESGKGVIICLYVDDMLIFGTDQVQVVLTKEFLSSRFSIKDMGEADVILGIRIKHGSNGIAISQSYYIKKVLKKLNYFHCTPVSTPIDTNEKLMPNNGQAVS